MSSFEKSKKEMDNGRNKEENGNSNKRKETVKIVVFLSVLAVLGVLEFIFKSQLNSLEDLVWAKLQTIGLGPWVIPALLWILGGFAWVVTYIGPLIAALKRKHVSGIPGVAFVFWIVAGLSSPYKWLAVLALADFGIVLIPIRLIFKNKSDK